MPVVGRRWDFDEVTFLSGSMCDVVLPWLPPLLDGSRTVAELQAASAERCQPTDLSHVLDCLDQQGLLQADDISPTGFAHACEALSSRTIQHGNAQSDARRHLRTINACESNRVR